MKKRLIRAAVPVALAASLAGCGSGEKLVEAGGPSVVNGNGNGGSDNLTAAGRTIVESQAKESVVETLEDMTKRGVTFVPESGVLAGKVAVKRFNPNYKNLLETSKFGFYATTDSLGLKGRSASFGLNIDMGCKDTQTKDSMTGSDQCPGLNYVSRLTFINESGQWKRSVTAEDLKTFMADDRTTLNDIVYAESGETLISEPDVTFDLSKEGEISYTGIVDTQIPEELLSYSTTWPSTQDIIR
jgi:hypothetical protein